MSPTLQESAALVGGHCWAERRVFELLGRWSATVGAPAAALALDRHSQHAAWRAGQWWERLPVLASVDRDGLVVPAAGWAAWAGPDGTGPDGGGPDGAASGAGVAALAVAYRVLLPHLVVAYGRHATLTSPVADGPVNRTLAQVRTDVVADWEEGEALLQDLLVDASAVAAAAAAVAAAERRFVA